jgi:alpha-L-fucosidase
MDDKLGIFLHWGVYAVPAFENEWYPRFMYRDELSKRGINYYQHHVKTYDHPGSFGYKDFIPMFKAENWNPAAWVALFQESGARYVVPVAEHHDGFAMYATDFTPWNAAKMGPKRDVIGELAKATRAAGMRFGVSSHRAFNWRYYTYRDNFDTTDLENIQLYNPPHGEDEPASQEWLEDWFARTKELIDKFKPDVLWFDFGWHFDEFEPYRPQVVAYYYNRALAWGKEVVLQYKDKIPDGVAVLDIERGKLDHLREDYWQTDTSVSYKSWSYIENDDLIPLKVLVHDLVDIVSKNGNLLLNIGPRADGVIPEEPANLLRGLGKWLQINGEAIYGTRPWHTYGEGPAPIGVGILKEKEDKLFTTRDIRFTQKENVLYAIALGWPGEQIKIKTLHSNSPTNGRKIARVSMLGSDQKLSWSQDGTGLSIQTPVRKPSEHAYTFKITLTKV